MNGYEENLNNSNQKGQSMKQIVRAGLGFIAGLFAYWGGNALVNHNWFGSIAIIIGIGLFYYGWKG